MSLFDGAFLDHVTQSLHALKGDQQKAGMKAIIETFELHHPDGDRRWLAYMLATAFHETAATMQPVREAFWLSENWRKSHLSYYPYYGRGYVQVTHKENYEKAGEEIQVDLVRKPDLALDPQNAARIMLVGMTDGWFRGDNQGRHTLARYFSRTVDDPVGARKIVNGREVKKIAGIKTTVGDIISRYYVEFLEGLNAATLSASNRQNTTKTFSATAALPSNRFEGENDILIDLAKPLSLAEPMNQMTEFRRANFPASHPRFWAIIDFRRRSDVKRLHIFDMEAKSVTSYLCAHGKGSDPENTGTATSFSNVDGSNMSSIGIYRCAETYFGTHGYSMRLDGLEPSNDQARHRAIVIHPADYVSDAFAVENHRVGRSLGCPAVDALYSKSIIDQLRLGSFLHAWAG